MVPHSLYTGTGRVNQRGRTGGEGKQEPTGLTRAQRQLDIKERRILQLEQQLASVRVEAEELRKRLAVAEQKLIRYRVIEEEIVQAGRRVIP